MDCVMDPQVKKILDIIRLENLSSEQFDILIGILREIQPLHHWEQENREGFQNKIDQLFAIDHRLD